MKHACECDSCGKGCGGWLVTISRVLIALLFVVVGFGKITGFGSTVVMVASAGFPMPEIMTVLAIIFEFGGGLMLLLGFHARTAAWMLVVFTVIATLGYHMNWANQMNMLMTLKNLAIIGGLLQVAIYGAGRWAVARDWKCPMHKMCVDCKVREEKA